MLGGTRPIDPAESPDVRTRSDLPDQGYRLTIRPSEPIRIEASSKPGAVNAQRTLTQLIDQSAGSVPCLEIDDAPAFATRGVLLDISRCRVPRMDHLRSVIALLGSLKINHLELYTEHAFAYRTHEQVWQGCSPITPDELRRIDTWCSEQGIELAANQNCFGHMTRWLTHQRYAQLAETHGPFSFWGMRRTGPFSLCPTDPGSLALVEDLLAQQVACVRSGLVNVGCDETQDVGSGRSRPEVERDGFASVYAGYVARVAAIARSLGRRAAFWADVALMHPEALELLPTSMLALAWGYEPTTDFASWCETLGDAGFESWVCPGTSAWRSITGRTSAMRGNLASAVTGGLTGGASGLMMTDWGDLGHRQVWPISLNALAQAADAAWTGRTDPPASTTIGARVFGDPSGRTAGWLDELGDADAPLRAIAGRPDAAGTPRPLANASALFTELHPPAPELGTAGTLAQWDEVAARLADLGGRIPAGAGPLIAEELALAHAEAAWAADVARHRRGGTARDLRARLDRLIASHRRLWLVRSRVGGLDESMAHLDRLRGQL